VLFPFTNLPASLTTSTQMATMVPSRGDINTVIYRFRAALRPQFVPILVWAILAARKSWCKRKGSESNGEELNHLLRTIRDLPLIAQLTEKCPEFRVYVPIYFERALIDNSGKLLNKALREANRIHSVRRCDVWLSLPVDEPRSVEEFRPLLEAWAEAERIVGKFINPAKHLSNGVQLTQDFNSISIYSAPNLLAANSGHGNPPQEQHQLIEAQVHQPPNQSIDPTGASQSGAEDMQEAVESIAELVSAPNKPMPDHVSNPPEIQPPIQGLESTLPLGQSTPAPTLLFVPEVSQTLNIPSKIIQPGEAVLVHSIQAGLNFPEQNPALLWAHEIHRIDSTRGLVSITRDWSDGTLGTFASMTYAVTMVSIGTISLCTLGFPFQYLGSTYLTFEEITEVDQLESTVVTFIHFLLTTRTRLSYEGAVIAGFVSKFRLTEETYYS
jgi:hypothetical protein